MKNNAITLNSQRPGVRFTNIKTQPSLSLFTILQLKMLLEDETVIVKLGGSQPTNPRDIAKTFNDEDVCL